MYATKNFKSKKELKAAVEAWNDYQAQAAPGWSDQDNQDRLDAGHGPRAVTYFQPGPFGGNEPKDGIIFIEGPHYPQAHRFYARCYVENGVIVKVK